MVKAGAVPFQCDVTTPVDGMSFEARTPLAVTGFAFLPLPGPAPLPPLPHLRPAKSIVVSQSIGNQLVDLTGTLTDPSIYNFVSGMMHAARMTVRLDEGVNEVSVNITMDAVLIGLDGVERTRTSRRRITVHAAGTGGTADTRPSEVPGILTGHIDPPRGPGGVIERFEYLITGKAKKTGDDQFLFIYIIDRSTGVVLDSFVVLNWFKSSSSFRATRTAPSAGGATARACRVVAQRILMRTGVIEGALVRDFTVGSAIVPGAPATASRAASPARLLLPTRGRR